MFRSNSLATAAMLAFALTLLSCSDDGANDRDGGETPDGVTLDTAGGNLPPGYVLWPCDEAGKACNAHDPCAINPVCGTDGKCRPATLQVCDDGLSCTKDVCKGMGLCEFTPAKGTCSLSVTVAGAGADGGADGGADAGTGVPTTEFRCFKAKEKNPSDTCQVCEPETSQTKWSGANGGYCDDGNMCTKDDYCQNGLCKGVSYLSQCDDGYGCTKDLCDGKGGCLGSKMMAGFCLINGTCYKGGVNHPSGTCYTCDASASNSSWTAISNTCTIGGKCYKPGDQDATKCGSCDPTKSTTAWTPLPGLCKIGGACYKKGAKNTGLCAECDPTASATAWTVKGSSCLISNVCKKPGDKDTTGCSSCDPTKDKYGWTPLTGLCLIGGVCYTSGAKHPQGCGECKPATTATKWTLTSTTQCLIGGKCYSAGAKDSLGCAKCDLTAPEVWTKIAGCFNIIFTALNKSYTGNLGGITGANALCQQQAKAAGYSGTFKAFLSSATQTAKSLITGTTASTVAVLNTKGEKLYNNWNEMFSLYSWSTTTYKIWTFNGTEVEEGKVTPDWYDGRAWTGSNNNGTLKTGYTCKDWTSATTTDQGANGELDYSNVAWPAGSYPYDYACSYNLAVVCVQTAP